MKREARALGTHVSSAGYIPVLNDQVGRAAVETVRVVTCSLAAAGGVRLVSGS